MDPFARPPRLFREARRKGKSMRLRPEPFFAPAGPARLRACLTGLCLLLALACLWAGGGLFAPLVGPAPADAFSSSGQAAEPEHIRLKKQLLQATVDSAAFSLAGVLAGLPDQKARRGALAAALDALTFDLGAPAYFTAWEDTRLLHSPLTPDTADFDFGDALDGRGVPFVRVLSEAGETGGFLPVLLRSHVFDRAGGPTASGPAVHADGAVSPARPQAPLFSPDPFLRERKEAGIVYSRAIPGAPWRISAFTPLPEDFTAAPASAVEGAGPVWEIPGRRSGNPPGDPRTGLYVAGFSFLGLAGVLLRL
jgi:hypothetical protein